MSPQSLNGDCSPDLASSNLAPVIGGIAYVTAALAIKIVVARFLVQRYVIGKIETSDWLMFLALVSLNTTSPIDTDGAQLIALVNTVLITIALSYGLGKH